MKKILILASVLILIAGCTTTSKKGISGSAPQQTESTSPTLTPKDVPPPQVKWSDDVNFTNLRETYGLRADFGQLCERDYPIKKITTAFDAGNFKEGVEIGDAWLNHCPIDSRVHTLVGYGYHQLGDETTGITHVKWSAGLIKSILSSGDGKTTKTPYVTISVNEEYALLRWLELQPKQQALLMGPPQLDALTVIDAKGNEQTVYFNPYLHFVRLGEMLKQIKSEKSAK